MQNIIHITAIFIVTVLSTLRAVDNRTARFIFEALRFLVSITFTICNAPSSLRDPILKHFPKSLGWGGDLLGLSTRFIYHTVCPTCCAVYAPPEPGSQQAMMTHCTSIDASGKTCGTQLLEERTRGETAYSRPIRRYPLQSIAEWIASMMKRPDFEKLINQSLPTHRTEQGHRWDIWNSDFCRQFLAFGDGLFSELPGHLMFAMAVDWLNPHGNLTAKKIVSIGVVYLVCLNLPLEIRYLQENICLLSIIPGFKEPTHRQVHHFFDPIVAELNMLWEKGVCILTPTFPQGRTFKVGLGPVIGDIAAIKKIMGFMDATATVFCHYCKITRDYRDLFYTPDSTEWKELLRTKDYHSEVLSNLRAAGGAKERDEITHETGVRDSAFSQLSYFSSPIHAGLDQMHMWKALSEHYVRDTWKANDNLPSWIYDDPLPNWERNVQEDLEAGEREMLFGNEKSLFNLNKPVLQELCFRRGINFDRTKGSMTRELQQWVR